MKIIESIIDKFTGRITDKSKDSYTDTSGIIRDGNGFTPEQLRGFRDEAIERARTYTTSPDGLSKLLEERMRNGDPSIRTGASTIQSRKRGW